MSLFLLLLSMTNLSAGEHIKHLTKDQVSPKANIEQVGWIAGHWQGQAFGGKTEEIWSKPHAGSMMAVFKHSKDNAVTFYEIEIIRETANSLILELKHFSKDLKGWEKKDEVVSFPLVALSENVAYFDGMTFQLINENLLYIYVSIESNGQAQEVLFAYQRVL